MTIFAKYRQIKEKFKIKRQIRASQMDLRIVVGSGGIFEPDWISYTH